MFVGTAAKLNGRRAVVGKHARNSTIFVDILSVCNTTNGGTTYDVCTMVRVLIFCLLAGTCRGQVVAVGGGSLWASSITPADVAGQAAWHFPQGTPAKPGLSLGLALGSAAPALGTGLLSMGIHRRFRVFHAAAVGSFSGDGLFSEQNLGLRGGLTTPRWGLGLGIDGNIRRIEGSRRFWPSVCAGLSLYWNAATTLHVRSSFSARQSLDDPLTTDGFSSTWLLDHRIGRSRMMGYVQQWETRGWDTGIACEFTLAKRMRATTCGSVFWRRFSLCVAGEYKNWKIAATALVSPLPGNGTLLAFGHSPGIRSP